MESGIKLIAEEREKQIRNYTNDENYDHAELVRAACGICYELPDDENTQILAPNWAWDIREKYQEDYKKRLTIAGALIAAEIDRVNKLTV